MLALFLSTQTASAELRLAIAEFTNASDDEDLNSLGLGLQSMLTTDLTGVQAVSLVERSKLDALQEELNLAVSSWVDPSTAAKVGKMAGASHLLAGSFTVVKDTMRLDARLVDVSSGKVVYAEALQGEKDAFFELEKDLVNKLVKILEVDLSPKERALVRRLHTADFDAFKEFSIGIEHFDAKRYDQALSSLGLAVAADADFKLARLTLEEYAEVIQKMRARADAIDRDTSARERLADLAEDREDAQIAQKMLTHAEGTDTRNKLAALHFLALFHNTELEHQDRFLRKRARDAYMQEYYAAAVKLWPALPLLPRATSSFGPNNVKLESFDADFATYKKLLWDGVPGSPEQYWPKIRKNHVISNIKEKLYCDYLAQYLYSDRRDRVTLYDRIFELRQAADAGLDMTDSRDRSHVRAQAKRLTKLSEFDRSTVLLKQLADTTTDSSQVRSIADDIEKNAELKTGMKGLKGPQLEYARLSIADGTSPNTLKRYLADWENEGKKGLANRRKLDGCGLDTNNHGPTWVDGHPVWTMQKPKSIYTGARTDLKRGKGLRYARSTSRRGDGWAGPDSMLILDGTPRVSVALSMTVSYVRPPEFTQASGTVSDKDAIVDVLFGFRDLRTPDVTDPVTREIVEKKPPHGYSVRLTADEVQLVKRSAVWDRSNQVDEWEEEVLERAKLKGSKHTLSVEVKKESVLVKVNGNTHKWKAPGLLRGFYGLGFRGEGFAAVDGLAVALP